MPPGSRLTTCAEWGLRLSAVVVSVFLLAYVIWHGGLSSFHFYQVYQNRLAIQTHKKDKIEAHIKAHCTGPAEDLELLKQDEACALLSQSRQFDPATVAWDEAVSHCNEETFVGMCAKSPTCHSMLTGLMSALTGTIYWSPLLIAVGCLMCYKFIDVVPVRQVRWMRDRVREQRALARGDYSVLGLYAGRDKDDVGDEEEDGIPTPEYGDIVCRDGEVRKRKTV